MTKWYGLGGGVGLKGLLDGLSVMVDGGGGCAGCLDFWAPYASRVAFDRIMNYNLGCLKDNMILQICIIQPDPC